MARKVDHDFLGSLYGAAADASAWSAALESFVPRLNAFHGHFHVIPRAGARPFMESVGLNEAEAARFSSTRAWELWRPIIEQFKANTPTRQGDLISDSEFERTEIYNEVVRPTGGYYSLAVKLVVDTSHVQITLCRPRSKGEFSHEEAARLSRLLPKLGAAAGLHIRLREAEFKGRTLTAALDQVSDYVMMLSGSGNIIHANSTTLRHFGDPVHWLRQAKSRHEGAQQSSQSLLDIAIAFMRARTLTSKRLLVVETARAGHMYLADLVPLAETGLNVKGEAEPRLALFIKEVGQMGELDKKAVADIYHLNRSECNIAYLLFKGMSVSEISERTRLSRNTVSFYLKQIFAKTETVGQVQLLAKLRTLTSRF